MAESNCNVVNGGPGNVKGITSEYLYDIEHRLVDQIVVSGPASLGYSRANIYAGGEYLGEDAPDSLVKTPSATASMLRITDQAGSLRSRWDLAGNMVTECTSFPYGEGYSCAGATPPTLYTGKDRDPETGFDYFGARYYSSSMGRFLSPDWALVPTPVPFATLDNPQSLNLYSYVGNNPLSKRDADGHHQECAPDKSTSSVVNGVQTVTVTAGACHEVSDGQWWLAFNPWGKLGGPAHRQTVQTLSEMLRNEGYDVQTEVKVPTPMGAKQTRYVDVVGVKKNTGETKMYQVGDRGKDGQPIAREKSALDDIEQATGVRPQFEDKSLGSQLENIEMGPTPSSMTTEGGEAEGDVVGEPESPIEIPPL